jgi:hypothetical protein
MSEKFGYRPPEAGQEHEPPEAVGMDEYKLFEKGQVAETGGLGPCFGVIVYSPEQKQALVGHFIDPLDSSQDKFENMLVEAQNKFQSNQDSVRVYMGGAAPTDHEESSPDPKKRQARHRIVVKENEERQRAVEAKVRSAGFENLIAKYNKYPDESMIMKITTDTGRIEFEEVESDEEL